MPGRGHLVGATTWNAPRWRALSRLPRAAALSASDREKKDARGRPFSSVAKMCSILVRSILGGKHGRLRRVIGGEILDVVLRQRRREYFHDRVLALRRFVVAERLYQIIAMLSREARKIGRRAVAVGAMTCRAHFVRLRLAGGKIGGVCPTRGAERQGNREQQDAFHHF